MTFTMIKLDCQVWYEKKDSKISWPDFFLQALQSYEQVYGLIPEKIVMSKKDVSFLGNSRGVSYKGNHIPVDTVKNCPQFNIQMHQ